jgi:ribosomal protein L40E
MSSAISTDTRARVDAPAKDQEPRTRDDGLQPWQFFVLAGLGCATALAYLAARRGVTSIILLTVLMATAALVGMAALRMLRPLVSADEERVAVVGQRTRAALEREKLLTLRAIKDLEFDRAMGKLSEADWQEMSGRLRARAASLLRRLDASSDYRSQIEAEVEKRLASRGEKEREASVERTVCAKCSTANEHDAKFCKHCGEIL